MNPGNDQKRVAFSPREFAGLFGKEATWAYRKIYSGAIICTTEFGRTMIPATEVNKILNTAAVFDGHKPKPPTSIRRNPKLRAKLLETWKEYILRFRKSNAGLNGKKEMHPLMRARLPWKSRQKRRLASQPWKRNATARTRSAS